MVSWPKQRISPISFTFHQVRAITMFWRAARLHVAFPGMRLYSCVQQVVKSPYLTHPISIKVFLYTHSNLTWSNLSLLPFIAQFVIVDDSSWLWGCSPSKLRTLITLSLSLHWYEMRQWRLFQSLAISLFITVSRRLCSRMSYLHLSMPLKHSDMTSLGKKTFYVKTSIHFNKN